MSERITFDTLQPIDKNEYQPQFLIAGNRWEGWYWKSHSDSGTFLRELRHDAGNVTHIIRETPKGYNALKIILLAPGVEAMKVVQLADSIEAAAAAAFAYEFTTREAAGRLWYQVTERDDYSSWTCAFDDHDAGEISTWTGTMASWLYKRVFQVGKTRYELSRHDSEDDSAENFEAAAVRCQSLFLDVLQARGGDAFAAGVKEGAAGMRAKILAAANQA